jgi:hypothetical protein
MEPCEYDSQTSVLTFSDVNQKVDLSNMPRPKGVPNKLSAQAKENIVAVFTRLGGTAAMAEWARRNQSEFYRLYARLISADSTTEVRFRDINDLSDAELLGIVTAGRPW